MTMDVTNENLYIVKSGQRQTTTRLSTQLTTRTVFAPGHIYTHNTRTACNTAVPCVPSGLACLHRRDRGKLVGIFQGRRPKGRGLAGLPSRLPSLAARPAGGSAWTAHHIYLRGTRD